MLCTIPRWCPVLCKVLRWTRWKPQESIKSPSAPRGEVKTRKIWDVSERGQICGAPGVIWRCACGSKGPRSCTISDSQEHWQPLRRTIGYTVANLSSWHWSGLYVRNLGTTCFMHQTSRCTLTTTHWHTWSAQQSWREWATAGLGSYLTSGLTSNCCQAEPISMQTHCPISPWTSKYLSQSAQKSYLPA